MNLAPVDVEHPSLRNWREAVYPAFKCASRAFRLWGDRYGAI